MKTISPDQLDRLVRTAAAAPRLRTNLNLHPTLEDPVQRFFNAIQPSSYVRPHRHTDPPRWELFHAIRGRASVLTFDPRGVVLAQCTLAPDGPVTTVELDGDIWHTLVALEADTLLFELKPGPYLPLADKDFAPWAPAEGSAGCGAFTVWMAGARAGERPPVQAGPRS
jgi:cupin fold WbuC family metalloprotein